MTDKSLRDVVLNFVIAGRDTTATTLAWAILNKYHKEDQESFNQRVAQFAGLLNYDSLGKLYYLHADGTKVKAGGMVTYVPYSMGRMEYNWGADAASFNPERWIKDGNFQNISPFKFTAFQAGPRICLGKDSAYLQMKMALAILCRYYEFKLVPGHTVKYRMMTILSMADGLKLTVSRRPEVS